MEAQRLGHPHRSLCGCQSSRAVLTVRMVGEEALHFEAVLKQSEW